MKNTKAHSLLLDKIDVLLPIFELDDCVSILSEQLNRTIKELDEAEEVENLEYVMHLLSNATELANASIKRINALNNEE